MEIWKNIQGYEGYYQVSNLSRVRRLTTYVDTQPGQAKRFVKGRILKHIKDNGYLWCALSKLSVRTKTSVHRIVATAFIPNPDNLPQVNHINGIKSDNRIENLEWCTGAHNIKHAWEIGLCSMNVPVVAISKITNERKYFKSCRDAGKELGIDEGSISRVSAGKRQSAGNWKFLRQ